MARVSDVLSQGEILAQLAEEGAEMSDKETVIKAVEYLNWYFTQDDGTGDKNAVKAWEVLLREQEAEIVRCKDCKYCEYQDSDKEWCKKGHLHGKAETWFCADGERR